MKLDTNKRKIFRVRNKLKKVHGKNRFRLSISRSSKNKTFRKIEPYKGKGIREKGQYVLKKEGKKK